jgi:hypothetical protein
MKFLLTIAFVASLVTLRAEAKPSLTDAQRRVLSAIKVAFQLGPIEARRIKRAALFPNSKSRNQNFCQLFSDGTPGRGCRDQGLAAEYIHRFAKALEDEFGIDEQLCIAEHSLGTKVSK